MRTLFRVVLYLCAAYGAWIVLGDAGLVTATPPSESEIVEQFLGWLFNEQIPDFY